MPGTSVNPWQQFREVQTSTVPEGEQAEVPEDGVPCSIGMHWISFQNWIGESARAKNLITVAIMSHAENIITIPTIPLSMPSHASLNALGSPFDIAILYAAKAVSAVSPTNARPSTVLTNPSIVRSNAQMSHDPITLGSHFTNPAACVAMGAKATAHTSINGMNFDIIYKFNFKFQISNLL